MAGKKIAVELFDQFKYGYTPMQQDYVAFVTDVVNKYYANPKLVCIMTVATRPER
jgi:hypothetical protein